MGSFSKRQNYMKLKVYKIICFSNVTHYRAATVVTVTLLAEYLSKFGWEDSVLLSYGLPTKPGWFGEGRSTISLLSMEMIVETFGLSFTNSWTHKSPTWIHLKISNW